MNNKPFVTEICDLMEQFDKAKNAWIREFGTEEGFNEWAIKRMGFKVMPKMGVKS